MKKSPLKSPKNFSATTAGTSGVCTQRNVSADRPHRKVSAGGGDGISGAFLDKKTPPGAVRPVAAGWGNVRHRPDYFLSSSSNLQENFSPQAGQVSSEGSMSPAKQTFSPQEGHSISNVSSSA